MLLIVDKSLPLKRGEVFHYVQDAADAAKPGDTVVVDQGTYTESVNMNVSGTPAALIKLYFRTGSLMIGDKRNHPVIGMKGKSHIYVQNMVSRGGWNGVAIDKDRAGNPSQHIVVDNCNVTLSISSGLRCAFSNNISLQFNTVHKTNIGGVHEMISMINTDFFLIHGNHVFNGLWEDENGTPIVGKEGIDVKDGSTNGSVQANHVHDLTRLGIYIDAWDEPTHNIVVKHNRVDKCMQGVALASEAGGLLKNVLVENNVLSNNTRYGVIIPDWVGDGAREDLRIVNNTIVNNSEGPIAVTTSNITGLKVANNMIIGNGRNRLVGKAFEDGTCVPENNVFMEGEA